MTNLKRGHGGGVLSQDDCVLIKRGLLDTQTRTQGECQAGIRQRSGDASTSQVMPKLLNKSEEVKREAWNGLSLTALGRNELCQRVRLGLSASRTVR